MNTNTALLLPCSQALLSLAAAPQSSDTLFRFNPEHWPLSGDPLCGPSPAPTWPGVLSFASGPFRELSE